MIKGLKKTYRALRRAAGATPMCSVIKQVASKGVDVKGLVGLELFGATGEFHTLDYVSRLASLDVWELDPDLESVLRRNLPSSRVKITDSFAEIAQTPDKYSFIVVDNPMSTYGDWCEHFELFPDVFRVAMDNAVIVLNVIPEASGECRRTYPFLFNDDQLARRAAFYDTTTPETVSFEQMADIYAKLATASGFKLDWWFVQKRTFVYYLVLHVSKNK
jgi:hypothetical protein